MAAGKSKIGRLLAERLRMPFVDSDAVIEERGRCSITDVFRDRGEAAFRDIERKTIAELVEGAPQVIAIGGGAFVDEQTRSLLNERARTVWLDTPFELVVERIARSTHRPLARNRPESELRALWEQRRPFYEEAQIRIDTSDAEPDRIVISIVEALA